MNIDPDTVYVDAAFIRYRRMQMSHMVSLNLEALHEMAGKIGIARRHFQEKSTPHYDVCKAKRAAAIAAGAVEIEREGLVEIIRELRTRNSRKIPQK